MVKTRLTKEEIAEIDREVELEANALRSLQQNIKDALETYMKKEKIGFNEVARRLNASPRKLSQIKKGQANLTFASVAQIAAMLGQEPVITFKKK